MWQFDIVDSSKFGTYGSPPPPLCIFSGLRSWKFSVATASNIRLWTRSLLQTWEPLSIMSMPCAEIRMQNRVITNYLHQNHSFAAISVSFQFPCNRCALKFCPEIVGNSIHIYLVRNNKICMNAVPFWQFGLYFLFPEHCGSGLTCPVPQPHPGFLKRPTKCFNSSSGVSNSLQ